MVSNTFNNGSETLPLSQPSWSLDSSNERNHATAPVRLQRRPSKVTKPQLSRPALACLNCRTKKVKCQLEEEGCKRCVKFKLQCSVPIEDERRQPSSKRLIRELQETIKDLEKALDKAVKSANNTSTDESDSPSSSTSEYVDEASIPTNISKQTDTPPSMLARLCGGQWQLNRDAAGQLRCFGPTSSLHVSESVSSSILSCGTVDGARSLSQWQARIPETLQNELLDIYWTYQHPVLHVIHRKAFLEGMASRHSPYFSELLLCCVFACAARMSDQPEVRALIFAGEDDGDDQVPFFAATVTKLLEVELRRPGITTVQSLLLLSVLDCAQSNDTKGWLYTGDACRLAYDLGLHRDFRHLGSELFSAYDLEVRQRVFWACFVFDRLWSMYLGRPHCIRLHDVTVPHMKSDQVGSDSDHQTAAAWADLLQIVGRITETINGPGLASDQSAEFDMQLDGWLSSLPASLQYQLESPPTISVLHMQYYSAIILLHRSAAHFGTTIKPTADSEVARQKCVYNACQIAQILKNYQTIHGAVSTMSGVALHAIATGATTLIANIAEAGGKEDRLDGSSMASQLSYLKQCMRALSQLEKSYHVTRRVRKIIQLVIQLSNLDLDQQLNEAYDAPSSGRSRSVPEIPTNLQPFPASSSDSVASYVLGDIQMESWHCSDPTFPFKIDNFSFPTIMQYDFVPFNEPCYEVI